MTLAVFIYECTARKELVFFMKKQIQIRNQDNERICDAYLDRKTEQITLVTKEGRHTKSIEYEQLVHQLEMLRTTTE